MFSVCCQRVLRTGRSGRRDLTSASDPKSLQGHCKVTARSLQGHCKSYIGHCCRVTTQLDGLDPVGRCGKCFHQSFTQEEAESISRSISTTPLGIWFCSLQISIETLPRRDGKRFRGTMGVMTGKPKKKMGIAKPIPSKALDMGFRWLQ